MKLTSYYCQYEPHLQLLKQSANISFGAKQILITNVWSRESLVSKAIGMGEGWSGVIPIGQKDFSLFQHVQIGSRAQPASESIAVA
jgi:hypothetical protein